MAAALADTSYSRGGFSPCLAGSARRVTVPGGTVGHATDLYVIHYSLS